MLYNRRGADFLCIAASKMASLPWDMTDVLYRCATTGQNVQICTRTTCLTTAWGKVVRAANIRLE